MENVNIFNVLFPIFIPIATSFAMDTRYLLECEADPQTGIATHA